MESPWVSFITLDQNTRITSRKQPASEPTKTGCRKYHSNPIIYSQLDFITLIFQTTPVASTAMEGYETGPQTMNRGRNIQGGMASAILSFIQKDRRL